MAQQRPPAVSGDVEEHFQVGSDQDRSTTARPSFIRAAIDSCCNEEYKTLQIFAPAADILEGPLTAATAHHNCICKQQRKHHWEAWTIDLSRNHSLRQVSNRTSSRCLQLGGSVGNHSWTRQPRLGALECRASIRVLFWKSSTYISRCATLIALS